MTESSDMLLVQDLIKRYGAAAPVLDGVSLTLAPGQTLAVVGPSGSGKSTLLQLLGSLDRPTAGVIRLGDIDVTALSGQSLSLYRARDVGFVFQDHHLLPQLTVLENVLLPTLAAGDGVDGVERARSLLAGVGLDSRWSEFPSYLSGGERQRIAVARALINRPRLLLADEPTGNLDARSAEAVMELFLQLARDNRAAVVMATHNPHLAARLGHTCELKQGRLHPWTGAAA